MSDKVEPVLKPEEWAYRAKGGTDPWFADDFVPGSPDRCARAIAIANAALPDSDPRKITRAMVDELRNQNLDEIADALESYLPPEDGR